MKNIALLKDKLKALNSLLQSCDETLWGGSISRLIDLTEADPDMANYELLRMLGGMGSLNDLVLYRDGRPLFQENDTLAQLRAEIYNECMSFRS